jgi:hypothetical protein
MSLGGLIAFGLGAVLMQLDRDDYKRLLEKVRAGIRKAGLLEKEVAYACGVTDPSQFSKMVNGEQRFPMDVYAALPVEVKQHVALAEVADLGLPSDVQTATRVAHKLRDLALT